LNPTFQLPERQNKFILSENIVHQYQYRFQSKTDDILLQNLPFYGALSGS